MGQGGDNSFPAIYFSEGADVLLIEFISIPLCHFAPDAGAEVLNLRCFDHQFGC